MKTWATRWSIFALWFIFTCFVVLEGSYIATTRYWILAALTLVFWGFDTGIYVRWLIEKWRKR